MPALKFCYYLVREAVDAPQQDRSSPLTVYLPLIKQEATRHGLVEITKTGINAETLIIAIGGDGTALRAMKLSAKTGAKILAVQGGHLGFLTDTSLPDAVAALQAIMTGNRIPESRLVLEYTDSSGKVFLGGNEFMLADKFTGTFHYWSFASSTFKTLEFSADAIMLATPTGSTAYNLSAGGSIVHPATPAVQVSAVAPVSLAFRSGIVPLPADGIALCATARRDANLVLRADGNHVAEFIRKEGENLTLSIKESQHKAVFLRPSTWSYFDVVSHKLGWGKVPGLA